MAFYNCCIITVSCTTLSGSRDDLQLQRNLPCLQQAFEKPVRKHLRMARSRVSPSSQWI